MRLLRPLAIAVLACLALPAAAQELTEDQAIESMEFAMHDAIFTLYHETGHLLIHELGLPVLGKEEDAADALAVILILKYTADEIERFNTLIDTADGWYFNAENTTGEGIDDLSYYDDHSLDIQRAYAMVCMMVGADPDEFRETADIYEMSPDRQAACGGVYAQAESSWIALLEPHFATEPGTEIPVTYDDPGDYQIIADNLREWQVLETTAEILRSTFVLPGPVGIRATQCGQANAFFDPGTHEMIYCYELASDMFDLYAGTFAEEDEAAPEDEAEPEAMDGEAAGSSVLDDSKAIAGSKGG